MAQDEIRDYVYISRLKVARLSETITRRKKFVVRTVQLGFGGASGTVDVSPGDRASLAAAIPPIEEALDAKYRIRHLLDDSLVGGQWFMADGIMMGCEVNLDYDAVIFYAEDTATKTRVILSGSSGHMLDRLPANLAGSRTNNNSGYTGMVSILYKMMDQQAGRDAVALGGDAPQALTLDGDEADARASAEVRFMRHTATAEDVMLYGGFSLWKQNARREPMSFLARAFDVIDFGPRSDWGDDHRYVLGTPLYVANEPPP